ncbi:MAG: thioredoxin family protein [Fimbriimonadaceae bacterium]|nr:thioredoxin family protein [Fimbriimonadaceae bacterium]
MADAAAYHDVNRDLFRRQWEQARPYDAYLATGDAVHRTRWEQALERTQLTAAQQQLLGSFTRRLHLLVLSGIWCGDCVRQGPIFRRLEAAVPHLELRLADRDEQPELTELLRINGAKKVPVAVYLSEDFYEVGRFGDRPLSVYRAKAARELGAACETGIVPPSPEALAVEIQEWVDLTEWMHLILRTAPLLRARYQD